MTDTLPPLPAPLVMVNRYGAGASTSDGDGGVFTAEQMRAYARAAIAAPPGWVLVPAEPTSAMLEAFFGHNRFDDSWRKAYRDMLASAPQPSA